MLWKTLGSRFNLILEYLSSYVCKAGEVFAMHQSIYSPAATDINFYFSLIMFFKRKVANVFFLICFITYVKLNLESFKQESR